MNKYKELDDPLTTITLDIQEDEVNSPEHYQQGTLETIEVVKGMLTQEEFLAYCAGSIIAVVAMSKMVSDVRPACSSLT